MPIPGFTEWFATPQGQYIMQWEQNQYDRIVADIFGFNALQIGQAECNFLRESRITARFTCEASNTVNTSVSVKTDAHHLPFASASIDLVVLPHVLEFSTEPHQVLREVERVLVPEGHLIITGFNPFSLWGLYRLLSSQKKTLGLFPWHGEYISILRLKDWLSLLGFETHQGLFGCYLPAVEKEKWLRRWHFMELAGNRWWPIAGSVYLAQAIKKVRGMHLIGPTWNKGKITPAQSFSPAIQQGASGTET